MGLELDFRILELENRKIFDFGSQNLLKTAKIKNVTSDSESPPNSRKERINSILATMTQTKSGKDSFFSKKIFINSRKLGKIDHFRLKY